MISVVNDVCVRTTETHSSLQGFFIENLVILV